MNNLLAIALLPEPNSMWIWLDGTPNTLLIDMSFRPEFAEMHEVICINDHSEYSIDLELTNWATGGTLRCQWIATAQSDPVFGVVHKFWSAAYGGILVELWEDNTYLDAVRSLSEQ